MSHYLLSKRYRWRARVIAFALSPIVLASGCATAVPYTGVGPHPQLERGAPVPPIDFLGNLLALPGKLLLWSWKFDNHSISTTTEEKLVKYLEVRRLPAMADTKFRLNQYRPFQDLARAATNRHVAWPYRLLIGLPMTLVYDVLLPGRVFPWGDYYNPWNNTVHLYSDHPAIALHEAGHAHDFAKRRLKGTYAFARILPFVDLYQEFQATDEAIEYLIETGDRETEIRAYKILYPAYGTYVGNYLFFPFGLVVVIFGHIHGRNVAEEREEFYQKLDDAAGKNETAPAVSPAPSLNAVP